MVNFMPTKLIFSPENTSFPRFHSESVEIVNNMQLCQGCIIDNILVLPFLLLLFYFIARKELKGSFSVKINGKQRWSLKYQTTIIGSKELGCANYMVEYHRNFLRTRIQIYGKLS